ncbi:MAG TPA: long-chain fatty acid--CoA ligase [Cyclobacteriaceae bacterium]|nr:long-chain fatty acid--CoA ligase [Cyclobacteriaceae bacterium]
MEITASRFNDFTRLFDLIAYQRNKYPNASAFNFKQNGRWNSLSIQQFEEQVDLISEWLLDNGYQKDDKVMLIPVIGSPDWMAIDFACQQIGAVTVPVHATLTTNELSAIATETQTRLCITIDTQLTAIREVAATSNSMEVYAIERNKSESFPAFTYRHSNPALREKLYQLRSEVKDGDLATIMYTSGSLGEPKGVMLSHRNIVHNIKSILACFPLEPGQRVLSFLPVSHILERATNYAYLAFGNSIYFSQNRETFTQDFLEVRPYFCTSVPRVLEKMYDYLQAQLLSRHWLKRTTIRWAMNVAKRYKERHRLPLTYRFKLLMARLLVLRHWRKRLGGRMRYMAVGAAALRPEIGRLLSASGVQVVEGYGLTETAPLVSINRFEPGMNRFGTVGHVIPGVEVKIEKMEGTDEGEILVKGPNVMLGYYLKPEATREAIDKEGWLHTGDIGQFVSHGFLQITDRKKVIFKTSSGKYIAPLSLQNHFAQSPYIQRCLIIGFQRPFVTALIVPHFEILESWCINHGVHWTAPEFMVHNIKVIQLLKDEVEDLNEALPNFQRVRNFVLCPTEWTTTAGELTTTLKPVRSVLERHYEKEIEKMYQ